MSMFTRFLLSLLVVAAPSVMMVDGFSPMHQAKPSRTTAPSSQLHSKLSEIDEVCIENVAEFCLQAGQAVDSASDGSCDVEEYQALVSQLQDQRTIIADHLAYVDSLLVKLQGGGDAGAKSEEEATYFAG